ncbi:MAG: chorismate-binding protein [Thermovirgaceae bacterium]|nr:chorismate-binding protein [Thermovirgaceae bacterium]
MTSRVETRAQRRVTSLETFRDMARDHDLVPLVIRMNPQELTPLSLYRKLGKEKHNSFLLESGDRGSAGGRYSFIGIEPERVFRVTPDGCEVCDGDGNHLEFHPSGQGTRKALDSYLACRRPLRGDDLPPFAGGVAGYFGYGMVEGWEDLFHGCTRKLRPSSLPRALLMGFATVAAFDHKTGQLLLIHNIRTPEGALGEALDTLYREGCGRLESLADRVDEPFTENPPSGPFSLSDIHAHTPKEDFLEMVRKGREHIISGDICQVVLSQRFSIETDLPSLEIYQALKDENPSPYLFFLNLPELELIGSSPEVLVRVERDRVFSRPLAGTRRRGASEAEDRALAKELLADEKERAEHLMLVDLARNDLGRVCKTGTIAVTELMGLERYSQVMHIVSQVEGDKRGDLSALDVLESAFPAGTVSGAPKIRAMEIIEELEHEPRGPYAGAVGYVGFDGDMDTCIVIRTMVREGNTVSIQAGAGVVYDSVPEKEYEETRSKARALFRALETALERENVR